MKNVSTMIFAVFMLLFMMTTDGFCQEQLSTIQRNDLGVFGTTWQIAEEDFLSFIENRIRHMQENGEMQAVQSRFQNAVRKKADRPVAVVSIHRTVKPETHLYDPSVVVPTDLRDTHGNVFAKAGTQVNPLKWVQPKTMLVFYDADDSRQAAWTDNIVRQNHERIKLVLVKGSVSEQSKHFHLPVYFDQSGTLTGRFNIHQVPAIVRAEGNHLRIDEVLP